MKHQLHYKNKILNFKEQGFALMTVLLVTVILIIIMISFTILISRLLFQTRVNTGKDHLLSLADSAITEVLLKMEKDPAWGKNNETLLMRSGKQDLSITGFNTGFLPAPNSEFTFKNGGFYYISFNPEDEVFQTEKTFYSVNNLEGSTPVPSWRPDIYCPTLFC